jgi:hypothetical protein
VCGGTRVAQWDRSLDLTTHTSLSPIRRGFAPSFVNYKKGALDSQPQVIKFTSYRRCYSILALLVRPFGSFAPKIRLSNLLTYEGHYRNMSRPRLLAQGRWFSPGTPASSTTKIGRHDIAESGVKHQNSKFQSN